MAERFVIEGNGANDALGTGRRKRSIARARVRSGSGKISINKRTLNDFFKVDSHLNAVMAPLVATEKAESVDVIIRVEGGGITGQADACKMAIARALKKYDPETEAVLRDKSLLTRDSREIERKKPGLRKARRATQFSKR